MRLTDTGVPVSAASALLALSTRAPTDLDLEPTDLLVDTAIAVERGIAMDIVDSRSEIRSDTPQPTEALLAFKRAEALKEVKLKSGGTQDAILYGLAEEKTCIRDGVAELKITNKHKTRMYLHVPKVRVSSNESCPRTRKNRLKAVCVTRRALSFVSNDEHVNNQSEIKLIESEMMHTPTKFQQALDNTDLLTPPPLSAQETAQIISICGMSGSAFNKLRKFVGQKRKFNMFASSDAVKERVSNIVNETESGFGQTLKSKKVPFIRFKNINKVLNDHVIPVIEKNSHKHGKVLPRRVIKIVVAGDKGGNSTKLCISVINKDKPQSRYNILPVAMYEGEEDYHFVKEFMSQTIRDIEQWAKDITTRYKNWKVQLLLGGDTYWLWDIMGLAHKGTHYCPLCECKIKINEKPHTTKYITKKNSPDRLYKKHICNVAGFNNNNANLKNLNGIQGKSALLKIVYENH